MKIEKLTLKELDVIEVNGEYEHRFINEKTYPIFLTNYSLKKGKDLGYIETSLFGELAKLTALDGATDAEGNLDASSMGAFDESKATNIIYLALIGANKDIKISHDEFLEKYHEDLESTLLLYGNLISNLVSSDPNQFAKEFQKATDKPKKK